MSFRFVRMTAVWALVLLPFFCQLFPIVTPRAPYTGGLAYHSTGSHLSTPLKKPPTSRYSLGTRTSHLPEVTMIISTIFPVTHTVGSNIIPERITEGKYNTIEAEYCHEEFRHRPEISESVKPKGVENEEATFYTHRAERCLPYCQLYRTKIREEDKVKTLGKEPLPYMQRKDSSTPYGYLRNEGSQKLGKKEETVPREIAMTRTRARNLRERPFETFTRLMKSTYTLPIATPSITTLSSEMSLEHTETTSDAFTSFIQDIDYKWKLGREFWKDCFVDWGDCSAVIQGITQGHTPESMQRPVWSVASVQRATAQAKSLKPKYHLYNFNEQVIIRASKPMQQDLPVEEKQKGDNNRTFDTPRKIYLKRRHSYRNKTSNYLDGDGSPDWPFDNDPFVWTNGTRRYVKQPDDLIQDPKPRLEGSNNGLTEEAEEGIVFSSAFVGFTIKNQSISVRTTTTTRGAPTPLPPIEELESKIHRGRIRPSVLVAMLSDINNDTKIAGDKSLCQQRSLEAETLQNLVSVYKTSTLTVRYSAKGKPTHMAKEKPEFTIKEMHMLMAKEKLMFTTREKHVSRTTQHDPWHEGTGKKETADSPKPPRTGNITLTTSGTITTINSTTSQANQQISGPTIAYFVFIIVVALWLGMGMGFCWGRGLSQKAAVVHPYGSAELRESTDSEGNGRRGPLTSNSPPSRDECTRYGFPRSFWS
ncbi:hypothetical protein EV426DRAFT_611179 [Tirmania nivea]|nr:hypothetical protein EV426DRAFT_611179 [Tirmania nivea]